MAKGDRRSSLKMRQRKARSKKRERLAKKITDGKKTKVGK